MTRRKVDIVEAIDNATAAVYFVGFIIFVTLIGITALLWRI